MQPLLGLIKNGIMKEAAAATTIRRCYQEAGKPLANGEERGWVKVEREKKEEEEKIEKIEREREREREKGREGGR